MTKLIDVFTDPESAVKAKVLYVYIPTPYYLVIGLLYHAVSSSFFKLSKKYNT